MTSFWQLRIGWRRVAVVAITTLAVILVLRLAANLWLAHQLAAESARLEKIYGPLDPAALAPSKVAPADNRARVVRAAASLTAVSLHDQTRLGFMFSSVNYRPPGYRESARTIVEQNRLAVEVAEQARSRPKSNWDIDYDDQSGMPKLVELRALSSVLMAACGLDVDDGRADDGARAATAGLTEAASLVQEPITIVQLMRTSIAESQLRCVRQVLDRTEPGATGLADLAKALAENRAPNAVRSTLVGELKYMNGMMARGDTDGATSRTYGVQQLAGWLFTPFARMLRLHYLRAMAQLIEVEQVGPFNRPPGATERIARSSRKPPWWHLRERFDRSFLSGLDSFARSQYRFESALNVAELAVALRRYRLDQATYPDTLASLAPRYVARVPIDPFTGRPPEYARQGAGFELKGHGPKDMQAMDWDLTEWRVSR